MAYYGGVRRYGSYKKYSGRHATAYQRRMHAVMVPYARRITPGRPARGLMPPTKTVTLRYVNTFICHPPETPVKSFYVLRTLRANGPWDPDVTGGGYSCKGYRLYGQYYNHCTCLASRLQLKVFAAGTEGIQPQTVVLKTDDDGSYFGRGDWRFWLVDSDVRSVQIRGGHWPSEVPVAKMSVGFNASRFFGVPDVRSAQRDYGGAIESNPNDQAFWNIAIGSTDLASAPPDCTLVVVADYVCYFTERKDSIGYDGLGDGTPGPEIEPPIGGGEPDPAGPVEGVADVTNPPAP